MFFKDRFDAGHKLVEKLKKYYQNKDVIILAIPRGSLQIGYILAKELKVPLDIILTKKITAPDNPEFAIGAASIETYYLDPQFSYLNEYIKKEAQEIQKKLVERNKLYKENQKTLEVKDKIVILVDDGIATGNTIFAAINLIKKHKPKKIIVAVPLATSDLINKLKEKVDEIVCLLTPEYFYAIGQFYYNFEPVEDVEAIKLLNEANK